MKELSGVTFVPCSAVSVDIVSESVDLVFVTWNGKLSDYALPVWMAGPLSRMIVDE